MKLAELIYDPSKGGDVTVYTDIGYDPNAYEDRESAARGLYEVLQREAERRGMSKDEVVLMDPETSKGYCNSRVWTVAWEAGPHDWAVMVMISGPWGFCEPMYGFDLGFYEA